MNTSGGKSTYSRRGSVGSLSLTGRLNSESAEETLGLARRAVADEKATSVKVSLTEVERLDATSLQILLALRDALRQEDRDFALDGETERFASVLTAMGLAA